MSCGITSSFLVSFTRGGWSERQTGRFGQLLDSVRTLSRIDRLLRLRGVLALRIPNGACLKLMVDGHSSANQRVAGKFCKTSPGLEQPAHVSLSLTDQESIG